MSNPFAAPVTSTNAEAYSQKVPRPRISHLLVWLATSVALVSISLAGVGNYPDIPKMFVYASVVGAITSAISITAIWILYQSRESFATMMRMPGHWMIFCHATLSIVGALFALRVIWFPDSFYDAPDWATSNAYTYRFWQALQPLAIGAAATAAYGYASWKNAGIWRWLFGFSAFFLLADTLVPIGVSFLPPNGSGVRIATGTLASYATALLSAAMVFVACFLKPEVEYRDWLHWLGVVVVGFGSAMGLLAFMI